MNRAVRKGLAAVPQVALAKIEFFAGGGHQDLVCGLALVALRAPARLQDPAQPRLPRINAERVFQILATEFRRTRRAGATGNNRKQPEARRRQKEANVPQAR